MKKKINSITLGGIFAASYAILTALFVYLLPVLSSFSMIVLPILTAYYSTKYNYKETILFNIATILVCFLIGLGDPFYCLLYVLPSLIVGDIFGLLNHLKIKFYATIFFQALTFSLLNYLTIVLAEIIYETSIINFLIPSDEFRNNFSLCVLFILSLSEAIICTLFVSGELRKLKIYKEVEKEFPNYGYIFILGFLALTIISYFFSNNFYYLFCLLNIILEIVAIIPFFLKIKLKEIIIAITSILLALICLFLAYLNLESLIFLVITFIFALLSIIVKCYFKNSKNTI